MYMPEELSGSSLASFINSSIELSFLHNYTSRSVATPPGWPMLVHCTRLYMTCLLTSQVVPKCTGPPYTPGQREA